MTPQPHSTAAIDSQPRTAGNADSATHEPSTTASPRQSSGTQRGRTRSVTLHFRRIYSPLSETFIRQPLQDMHGMGVNLQVLTLIRAMPQNKPMRITSLVPFRGILRKGAKLRKKVVKNVGLSDPDTLIWPLIRPLLLMHTWLIRPRLIHAHFGPDGCLIAPIAKRLGIPLIVNFYGYDVSRIMKVSPERWTWHYERLFDQASALVAISEHIAGKLESFGAPREKIHVIPLGIQLERFQDLAARREARLAAQTTDGPPVVRCLLIGRLTAKKDPVGMITAFAKARTMLAGEVDLRLDIVGDGPLREIAREAAANSGHANAIHFHGSVGHDRIPDLLVEADIYTQHCVTAPDGDMEGLGVTFMEASAAGLPIIGTRHNGIPEVVAEGQTGLLVDEHDYDTMAEHITALARDSERRRAFGQAGMARAAERFTIDQMIQRVLTLHEAVAPTKAR